MKFLKDIREAWKSMTANEKVKLILEAVCDFGGGAIIGVFCREASKGCGRLAKAAVYTTGLGLGVGMGRAAAKELEDLVDVIVPNNPKIEEAEAKTEDE